MYKPCRLIGLELGISVLSGALRGKPTEQPQSRRGDVVAVAERELSVGGTLDGEGGYTVWGKIASAEHSLAHGALPIGLASHVELQRYIAAGMTVWPADVAMPDSEAVAARRDMEQRFAARVFAIAAP
jgi:predicted homoserine dehydrogenase-like protein